MKPTASPSIRVEPPATSSATEPPGGKPVLWAKAARLLPTEKTTNAPTRPQTTNAAPNQSTTNALSNQNAINAPPIQNATNTPPKQKTTKAPARGKAGSAKSVTKASSHVSVMTKLSLQSSPGVRHLCKFSVHSVFNTGVACGSLILGLLLQMFSIFSMDWSKAKVSKSAKGIWFYTYDDLKFEYPESKLTDWHQATRVLATIATVLGWLTVILCPVHTVQHVFRIRFGHMFHWVASIIAAVTATGACLGSIGVMVLWAVFIHDSEKYVIGEGFITCLTGALLIQLGGIEVYKATTAQHDPER